MNYRFWPDSSEHSTRSRIPLSASNSDCAGVCGGSVPNVQQFATGATRGKDDCKIDFEGHLSPEALHYYGLYMHSHRIQVDGTPRASDNWQQGIPLHKYMKSLLRHIFDLWRAWRGTVTHNPETGEPQTLGMLCAAILFNVQGFLHELLQVNGAAEKTFVTKDMRRDIEHGGHPTAVFGEKLI